MPSIYPEPSRGSLSDDQSKYATERIKKGPKSKDTQFMIILFGVIFFVVFLIWFAFYAGLGQYF